MIDLDDKSSFKAKMVKKSYGSFLGIKTNNSMGDVTMKIKLLINQSWVMTHSKKKLYEILYFYNYDTWYTTLVTFIRTLFDSLEVVLRTLWYQDWKTTRFQSINIHLFVSNNNWNWFFFENIHSFLKLHNEITFDKVHFVQNI